MSDDAKPLAPIDGSLEKLRARTPARLLVSRVGPAYRTGTWLKLREDHAAALDAVHAELDPVRDFGDEFVEKWRLFEICTQAGNKQEYLLRPDLGRRLAPDGAAVIADRCGGEADVQIVVGDGLSAAAVVAQVPTLLPLLTEHLQSARLRVGQPFVVRHCRVGVLNEIGPLVKAAVVVLLVGERPGLATAESLSAYLAFRPRPGNTDADRNLISNIHATGVRPVDAAPRLTALCEKLIAASGSGFHVKE
jgi:ethanolamine ammonia-lyase small subunit